MRLAGIAMPARRGAGCQGFQQVGEWQAQRPGAIRVEAGGRHAGQGVHFQEPDSAILADDEIGAGKVAQAQDAVGGQSDALQSLVH